MTLKCLDLGIQQTLASACCLQKQILCVCAQSLPRWNYVFAACQDFIYSYTSVGITHSKLTELTLEHKTTTWLQISATLLVFILNTPSKIYSLCQTLRLTFVTLQVTRPLIFLEIQAIAWIGGGGGGSKASFSLCDLKLRTYFQKGYCLLKHDALAVGVPRKNFLPPISQ